MTESETKMKEIYNDLEEEFKRLLSHEIKNGEAWLDGENKTDEFLVSVLMLFPLRNMIEKYVDELIDMIDEKKGK